jgi:hypothetical protein
VSAHVQPALDKQQETSRPRWTGRKRDPERFRARVLCALRREMRQKGKDYSPQWQQNAWEAWHIVKHLYAGDMYCGQCAPFIRAPLFPAQLEREMRRED